MWHRHTILYVLLMVMNFMHSRLIWTFTGLAMLPSHFLRIPKLFIAQSSGTISVLQPARLPRQTHLYIPTRKRSEITSQTMTISEWHQRLCHLNQWDIIHLSKDPATGKDPKFYHSANTARKARRPEKHQHLVPPVWGRPNDANIPWYCWGARL